MAGSGDGIEVIDPATEAPIASVAGAGAAYVDAAVQAADSAFNAGVWTDVSPYEKSKILWRAAELLERNAQELAWLNTLENGKPLSASATGNLPVAAKTFRHYAGLYTKIEGRTTQISFSPADFHAYSRYERRLGWWDGSCHGTVRSSQRPGSSLRHWPLVARWFSSRSRRRRLPRCSSAGFCSKRVSPRAGSKSFPILF